MEVEEHFAFKATCEHENDKKYNVYPTREGATFRKDKDEDSDYDSDDEMPSLYDSDAEDSDYDSEADEDSRSPTPRLPEPDPTTEAKTTNIEMQPKIIENPDLIVTFTDEEEDEDPIAPPPSESVLWKSILPPSEYLLYFGWETRYGFHDYTPFESAIYKFGDNTIRIDAPPNLKAIRDTAAFYFLTQVKDETIRLNAEVKSSKFLQPSGIAEIDFHFSLLSAKILDYASNYGRSTSPSWTLAKDVPEDIIKAMLSYGHNTPLFVHMAQIHIFYMAYIEAHIETFSPDIDVTTFRNAEFQFLGLAPPAQGTSTALRDSRKTINWVRITAYKDDLVLSYLVDYEATENWERDYNAPHDDDGPPSKRRRTGDYEPGDNEPERYSPTSPEYCP
jgi:hypothetical protein